MAADLFSYTTKCIADKHNGYFYEKEKRPFDVVFNCLLELLAKNEGCFFEKQNKKIIEEFHGQIIRILCLMT
jgi:hypothetical protein